MLYAHERVGTVLDEPILAQGATAAARGPNDTEPSAPTGLFAPVARPRAPGDMRENCLDAEEIELSFLQPSQKPEMLGRLDHYEVMEVLGQGGFGVVLKVFDEKLCRVVAIKVLKPSLAVTSPPRKRFLREARSAAAVCHQHVITIYAVEDTPIPYLVMEYVAGRSLQQKLDDTGPLDLTEILRIGHQIASGLAASHATGLIHRDIKPSNIMLEGGSERVKITDFGLARTTDDANITQSGFIVGTPMYMAPEQALCGPIDQRSDLFSLGSVLYAACSGRPPFRAPSTFAILKRLTEDTPRPIREIIPETPEWLCATIAKLQAKRPADRYDTAIEVADLLERCLSDVTRRGSLQTPITTSPAAASPAEASLGARAHAAHALSGWLRKVRSWQGPTVKAFAALLLVTGSALGLAKVAGWFDGESRRSDSSTEAVPRVQAVTKLPAARQVDGGWGETVRGLSESQQKTAIAARLKELNPEFVEEAETEFQFEDSVLKSMSFRSDHVADISFLSAFPGLETLDLHRSKQFGKIADLTPLRDLHLRYLELTENVVADLTPLEGQPLESVTLSGNRVHDLRPLKKSPLNTLILWGAKIDDSSLPPLNDIKTLRMLNIGGGTKVTDLSSIKGLRLETLCINITEVNDLSPLQGMPLKILWMDRTHVEDLSPLKGMRLTEIAFDGSPIRDISVLRDMPLEIVGCDFDPQRDAAVLRSIPTLQKINAKPAAEFWKDFDAGQGGDVAR